MDPFEFEHSAVSQTEDGKIAIALSAKNDGETQLILKGSVHAAKNLAFAINAVVENNDGGATHDERV